MAKKPVRGKGFNGAMGKRREGEGRRQAKGKTQKAEVGAKGGRQKEAYNVTMSAG
jgi:hypothetical protein